MYYNASMFTSVERNLPRDRGPVREERMTEEPVRDRVQSQQRDLSSAHRPTLSGGEALVLYLLPNGAIEFTQS